MRTIHAATASPEVAGIVVCGAAGVGKSRIVREALTAAAANGAEIRWAVATSSAKELPLATFAAWAEAASIDSLQLVRGVIESLTAAPPDTPVVVGVDDAHLLDDLSAFVLHQIVARGTAKVVMTVRDGEPVPAAIQDVWKGGQLDRLDLQPLSMNETSIQRRSEQHPRGYTRRAPAVEADWRKHAVSPKHRRARARRRAARKVAGLLAMAGRSSSASGLGRADRLQDGLATRERKRRNRPPRRRRAD